MSRTTCHVRGHNKYGARKVSMDGKAFDSVKEAKRYRELRLLEAAGAISHLRCQVPYVLLPALQKDGIRERAIRYVADFVYEQDGHTVVEDVKGYKQGNAYALFAVKRKLMLWMHGIHVTEV